MGDQQVIPMAFVRPDMTNWGHPEHEAHVCDLRCVPRTQLSFEGCGITEHVGHVRDSVTPSRIIVRNGPWMMHVLVLPLATPGLIY